MANVAKAKTPTAGSSRSSTPKSGPAGAAGGQQAKPQISPSAVANLTGSILKTEAMNQIAAHLRAANAPLQGAQGPVLAPATQGAPPGPVLPPGQVPGPQMADPRQLAMLQLIAAGRAPQGAMR